MYPHLSVVKRLCLTFAHRFVAQGWLDITYLSPDGCFRLSRGNKGTLFVLVRDDPSTDRLLAAITSGASDARVRPHCLPTCEVSFQPSAGPTTSAGS